MGNLYYVMKVNNGNKSFWPLVLYHFLEANDQYLEKLKGKCDILELEKALIKKVQDKEKDKESVCLKLYTGYESDKWKPIIKKNKVEQEFFNGKSSQTNESKDKESITDFYNIAIVNQSQDIETKAKVLIFTERLLFFLEPTGKWEKVDHIKFNEINLPKQFQPQYGIGKKSNSIFKHALIQLKIVKIAERNNLPPAIDSLSTYQYLTRGTLRHIGRMGSSRVQEDLKKSLQGQDFLEIPRCFKNKQTNAIEFKKDSEIRETPIARLYRYVLDTLIGEDTTACPIKDELLPYWMITPVQLEAAAAIFARDLNYMPQFYIAKSTQHVDVRAEKIMMDSGIPEEKKKIIEKLCEVLNLNEIIKKNIITIQCKNYENVILDHIHADILFTPQSLPKSAPMSDSCPREITRLDLETVIETIKQLTTHPELFELFIWWKMHEEKLIKTNSAN